MCIADLLLFAWILCQSKWEIEKGATLLPFFLFLFLCSMIQSDSNLLLFLFFKFLIYIFPLSVVLFSVSLIFLSFFLEFWTDYLFIILLLFLVQKRWFISTFLSMSSLCLNKKAQIFLLIFDVCILVSILCLSLIEFLDPPLSVLYYEDQNAYMCNTII